MARLKDVLDLRADIYALQVSNAALQRELAEANKRGDEFRDQNAGYIRDIVHLEADLAAARATNEELKSELEDVIRVTKKTDEEVEKAHRFALEKERASRLLADDTLLKCQNNALKFMYEAKELRKGAERYRKLRVQQWNTSNLFVVAGGKDRIRLGTDCPSLERLDALVDAIEEKP